MKITSCIGLALALSVPTLSMAEASRQDVVAARGADVMPFSLKATTHVFTKTDQGGIQQVVAKDPKDAQQVRLTREHHVIPSSCLGRDQRFNSFLSAYLGRDADHRCRPGRRPLFA